MAQDDHGGSAQSLRRRGEVRFRRRLRVVVGTNAEEHVGFTIDVSEHGLFVATHHFPTRQGPVDLVVELAGGRQVRLQGHVRWMRDPPRQLAGLSRRGLGVYLRAPPPEWTAFIASLQK